MAKRWWLVPLCAAAVVCLAFVQHLAVLHVDVSPQRFIVPVFVGGTFGALLAWALGLMDQARVLVEQLTRREEEISELNRTLERRVKEKQAELLHAQRLDIMGRLTGGITHDFNNVLTTIMGNTASLRDELRAAPPEQRELVEDILVASQGAARLASQLLSLARRKPATPALVDLKDVVGGLEPILRRMVTTRTVLRFQLEPGCVLIDRTQLEQLVLNLCINARDATPDGGTLTVRAGTDDTGPFITVSDTGVGMDAETKARLFEPFFTTKPIGKGTGLGLLVVKEVVDAAAGTIDVLTAPGSGTSFTVRFPTVVEVAPAA